MIQGHAAFPFSLSRIKTPQTQHRCGMASNGGCPFKLHTLVKILRDARTREVSRCHEQPSRRIARFRRLLNPCQRGCARLIGVSYLLHSQQSHRPRAPQPGSLFKILGSASDRSSVRCREDTLTSSKAPADSDLLTNLMHWCDRFGQDFQEELRRAQNHYREG